MTAWFTAAVGRCCSGWMDGRVVFGLQSPAERYQDRWPGALVLLKDDNWILLMGSRGVVGGID